MVAISNKFASQFDVLKPLYARIFGRGEILAPEVPETVEDLVFYTPPSSLREVERYWLDRPYSFVSVLFDDKKKHYQYHIVEPRLNRFEKTLLEELVNLMGDRLSHSGEADVNNFGSVDRYDMLRENTRQALSEYFDLQNRTFEKLYYYLMRDFIEFGPISGIMKDPHIEDIWCNGVGIPIFVYHKGYGNIKTNVVFQNDEELDSFVTLTAQQSSRHVSRSTPILDTVMRDGSRINITYGHEISPKGSSFSIRRQKEVPITPIDLIAWGTYSSQIMAYYWLCMEHGKNILFCGGTASGKTSSLNAICLFIPMDVRIVTLEDTREINLPHKNWISTITREGLSSGKMGTIDLETLLRASLRQRPEYLLVGEVRGREAQTLFQAMNAGHATCSTFHAGSPAEVINRFTNPPINVPPAMFSALDIIAMQSNIYENGIEKRKASHVSEIVGVSREIKMREAFSWDPHTDEFVFHGGSKTLRDIQKQRGWSDQKIEDELNHRTLFLDLLLKGRIRDYESIIRWIQAYGNDPEVVVHCLISGKECPVRLVKNAGHSS